jgi:virulence-associated protein VagC
MGVHEAKTFRSRGKVALRLPDRLAIAPGENFLIEAGDDRLTISRLPDRKRIVRKLRASLAALEAIGGIRGQDRSRG